MQNTQGSYGQDAPETSIEPVDGEILSTGDCCPAKAPRSAVVARDVTTATPSHETRHAPAVAK